jgi:hypothetical protein
VPLSAAPAYSRNGGTPPHPIAAGVYKAGCTNKKVTRRLSGIFNFFTIKGPD